MATVICIAAFRIRKTTPNSTCGRLGSRGVRALYSSTRKEIKAPRAPRHRSYDDPRLTITMEMSRGRELGSALRSGLSGLGSESLTDAPSAGA
jgi:hypothetical protein